MKMDENGYKTKKEQTRVSKKMLKTRHYEKFLFYDREIPKYYAPSEVAWAEIYRKFWEKSYAAGNAAVGRLKVCCGLGTWRIAAPPRGKNRIHIRCHVHCYQR